MRRFLFVALVILAAGSLLFVMGLKAFPPAANVNGGANNGAGVTALDKPTVSFGNPYRGPKDAKVAVIVFGDYQCEACAGYEPTLAQLLADYPKDVRVVWKDMPNSAQHPEAINAAVAARCAGDQGAFWPYHDLLMSQGGAVIPANYEAFASQLKLNMESFRGCVAAAQTKPLVERDYDEGQRLRIEATPATFIGDRRLVGATSYDQLKGLVDAALAR